VNKYFSTQCSNLTKCNTVIVDEFFVDFTDLVLGIYVNFHRLLLCKKCDVGYYVIKHDLIN